MSLSDKQTASSRKLPGGGLVAVFLTTMDLAPNMAPGTQQALNTCQMNHQETT